MQGIKLRQDLTQQTMTAIKLDVDSPPYSIINVKEVPAEHHARGPTPKLTAIPGKGSD